MIRLRLAGDDTVLFSSLCAACPQGPTGCCASPPPIDWSDVARIARHGGRDWLLEEMRARRLEPTTRGLATKRRKTRASGLEQRRARCVYHGPEGCTIPHERRSATCNYYLCDDAFAEGGLAKGDADARAAKAIHAEMKARFERIDDAIAARVRDAYPDGPPFDAPFLDWLVRADDELRAAESKAIAQATDTTLSGAIEPAG